MMPGLWGMRSFSFTAEWEVYCIKISYIHVKERITAWTYGEMIHQQQQVDGLSLSVSHTGWDSVIPCILSWFVLKNWFSVLRSCVVNWKNIMGLNGYQKQKAQVEAVSVSAKGVSVSFTSCLALWLQLMSIKEIVVCCDFVCSKKKQN